MICDWWISIRFMTSCVSSFVASDRNDDKRQRKNVIVKAAFELQRSRVFEKPRDLHQQSTYCNGLPNKTINVTTHIV